MATLVSSLAARLVVHATTTEMRGDIQSACEAMVEALDLEGWMTAEPATSSRGGAAEGSSARDLNKRTTA